MRKAAVLRRRLLAALVQVRLPFFSGKIAATSILNSHANAIDQHGLNQPFLDPASLPSRERKGKCNHERFLEVFWPGRGCRCRLLVRRSSLLIPSVKNPIPREHRRIIRRDRCAFLRSSARRNRDNDFSTSRELQLQREELENTRKVLSQTGAANDAAAKALADQIEIQVSRLN